jgi:phosphoribosyl-ATP pyrophosphohydrolase/phosphoribosyl-AMP cyclohydrolase
MTPDFNKYPDGLLPAIVQDNSTDKVLMLGFMNEEAWETTKSLKKVTFYSRSKKRLWTKGETSGNFLIVLKILIDCDNDTLLIKAKPTGPACHSGADTCFNETNSGFTLKKLEQLITERKRSPSLSSYTSTLFESGINRIAQKVGEEAVELVIESIGNNKDKFLGEAADLIFHYLILLQEKGFFFQDVVELLENRNKVKVGIV